MYISYNGVEEPLVQSQVLPYLRRLVDEGYTFQLLTFERKAAARKLKSTELEPGITWQPVNQAGGRAGVISALIAAWRIARAAVKSGEVQLVHARSYPSAMIAAMACRGTAVPWVFDMRGFWVDEKVLKGKLNPKLPVFWILKRIERALIRNCSAIVSLTHKALPGITKLGKLDQLPTHAVIPTCVDLNHFSIPVEKQSSHKRLTFGYVGSVGPGYASEDLAEFFACSLEYFPDSRVLILSRSDESVLQPIMNRLSKYEGRVEVESASYKEMPKYIGAMDIGLSFITPHLSKDASAATKVAEYLACGVFVIANKGIGDIDYNFSTSEIGLAIDIPGDIEKTVQELKNHLFDRSLREKRRSCAEEHFSVDGGASRYAQLYKQMIEKVQS